MACACRSLDASLAEGLSTPEKIRSLTWDELTTKSDRFAGRVPFNFLARIHFVACLASGQELTSRFVDSTLLRLHKARKKWTRPDIVGIEEGWGKENPRDYVANINGVALEVALRERDQLREQLRALESKG